MNKQQMDALTCGFQAAATRPFDSAYVERPGVAARLVDMIRRLAEADRTLSRERAALADREVIERRAAIQAPHALRHHQRRDMGMERDRVADVVVDTLALVRDQRGGLR